MIFHIFIKHTWSVLLSHCTFSEVYGVTLLEVMYQTQENEFHHILKHQKELNCNTEWSIFEGL